MESKYGGKHKIFFFNFLLCRAETLLVQMYLKPVINQDEWQKEAALIIVIYHINLDVKQCAIHYTCS